MIDKEGAIYDEGPLMAKKVEDVDDDIDEKITEYSLGENVHLDPSFLTALGTVGDRGLAADTLRLVQNDGDIRQLYQREK